MTQSESHWLNVTWRKSPKEGCVCVCVCERSPVRLFDVCVIVICVVSDAIATQSDWSFAKTPPLLTALFCKVSDFTGTLSSMFTYRVTWAYSLSVMCLHKLIEIRSVSLHTHTHTHCCWTAWTGTRGRGLTPSVHWICWDHWTSNTLMYLYIFT